jgi:hypothetical protein
MIADLQAFAAIFLTPLAIIAAGVALGAIILISVAAAIFTITEEGR